MSLCSHQWRNRAGRRLVCFAGFIRISQIAVRHTAQSHASSCSLLVYRSLDRHAYQDQHHGTLNTDIFPPSRLHLPVIISADSPPLTEVILHLTSKRHQTISELMPVLWCVQIHCRGVCRAALSSIICRDMRGCNVTPAWISTTLWRHKDTPSGEQCSPGAGA